MQPIAPLGVGGLMSDTQRTVLLDVSGLPPSERARRYRELADRHLGMGAGVTSPEAGAAHLELAALWTRLATEAERQSHAEARDLGADPSVADEALGRDIGA